MSTVKNNTISRRFLILAKTGEYIFHTRDLANLWHIKDRNLLYTTLKRYTKQGLLIRLYRGLYAIKPIDELDPLLLGLKVIHGFAYISTETVLMRAGIINQQSDTITLVSSKSMRFSIGGHHYTSRQLTDTYLFNPIGIENNRGIKTASPERAVADLLYFNPHAYFDAQELIDWSKVKKIQSSLSYPLYASPKPKRRHS